MSSRLMLFPMIGPTGRRDNLERLFDQLSRLLPPGVLVLDVLHDRGCPASGGDRDMQVCTCAEVLLSLSRPMGSRAVHRNPVRS